MAIGWRSPIAGRVRVAATVADAHGGCGNGVAWSVELRRGGLRRRLAGGAFGDGQKATIAPIDGLDVQAGDLISLVVGPRDGNHGCDTTEVDLDIAEPGAEGRRWRLAPDVSGDLLAGNPHADRLGHPDVWHFYSEPVGDRSFQPVVPAGSLLARWLESKAPAEKARLAGEVEKLLTAAKPPAGKEKPDAVLYRQARSLEGPLFGPLAASWKGGPAPGGGTTDPGREWGLDPSRFGQAVVGRPVDGESLGVAAPSVLEVRLPADLVAGREFVVTGELEPVAGAEGSVQLELTDAPPPRESLDRLRPGVPIVARDGSRARERSEAALAEFRRVFPAALCFRQIVPVDEVVTMNQLFRADEPFARLMLVDADRARLDRLWDELHYVSQDKIRVYQNLDQMLGFASQEGQTAKVEGWRKPITAAYEAAVKVQAASEPKHLDMLLAFAARAYRRPLLDREKDELQAPLPAAPRRGAGPRRGVPAGAGAGAGVAGVPLPGRAARAGQRGAAGLGLGARQPAQLLPLGLDARRRADPAGRRGPAPRPRRPGRPGAADGPRRQGPRPGHRVRLPVAGNPRLRHPRREERAAFPDLRVGPPRPVRGGGAVLRRPVRPRRVDARTDRYGSHILERVAGEALRHPGRDGTRMAAGRGGEGARPRRRAGDGRDPGEAVGRLAHQPGPAGQLAAREPAGRATAQAAQERPAAPRR